MEYLELLKSKISTAKSLICQLSELQFIEGIAKFQKKIIQESLFLESKLESSNIQDVVKCTNLTHFAAVVRVLFQVDNVLSVDHVLTLGGKKIGIDIICDGGCTWIKVIARNSRSLSRIYAGDCNYGSRTIVDHAVDIVECAKKYPCYYKTPKVVFYFMSNIDTDLKNDLESLSVNVCIFQEKNQSNNIANLSIENTINHLKNSVRNVNLDVSTMIAYVSNLTNGEANWVFKEPLLTDQAKRERERPVKPVLDQLFHDANLICCRSAEESFISILNVVGGPDEQKRGRELLDRVLILPDATLLLNSQSSHSSQAHILKKSGKIKKRSSIVFDFGHRTQSLTVSANDGFVRATKQQGAHFVTFIHESRALTELKQRYATSIDPNCN